MKVKTDYKYGNFITAGKEYEFEVSDSTSGYINSDDGDVYFILLGESECAHLGYEGSWSIVE